MPYTLPNVTLEPSGIATVDINAALQQQGIAPWATLGGYVEVKYAWGWDPLCVTVHNVDPRHSEIFNFNLRPSVQPGGQSPAVPVEGLWWKQEPNVGGFLALTNLSSKPQKATVQVSDRVNTSIGQHTVTVEPHGTKLVDMVEVRSSASSAGGVRVTLDGLQGDWVVNGWLEDEATGYSANIPVSFPARSTLVQQPFPNIAELGLMTGAASSMLSFPSGTVFTPYSVVRNISDKAVTVKPTLWWMEGAAPRSASLPAVTVPSKLALNLDVPSFLSNAGLRNFSGSVNLVLDAAAPPSALLLAAGSVDQKNTYVFQVAPFAASESAGRSISYWSTGNGDDTMVTLWNPADEAQDFLFTLMYSGGHYAYPVHLDPRATRMFNISEVIRSQIPDGEGNVVPLSVHEGSAALTGAKSRAEHILVSMEEGTYNVQKATCGVSCVTCNGGVAAWIDPDPASVDRGASTPLTLTVEWYDGYSYNDFDDTGGASWTSSDTSIATVSGGSMTGVNPGSVTITANDPNYPVYDSCAGTYCPQGMGATTSAGVYQVSINSADVTTDTISTTLGPNGQSGPFSLWLADSGSTTYYLQTSTTRSGGTYNDSFNVNASMPATTFANVFATWTIGGFQVAAQRPYRFQNLGSTHHSQYTVIQESTCSGSQTPVYIITNLGACYSSGLQSSTLASDFASQTALNGTGLSRSWGYLKAVAASSCRNATSGKPPDATNQNTFVEVSSVTGACNSSLGNSNVAAFNHACGQQIQIQGYPTANSNTQKSVQDECPACGNDPPHFDNFTTTPGANCSKTVPDLGYFVTLVLQ
ncbi:MAG TPA: Ig-like domain-containing protein [Terriglobia bacterium]|nr:Ig-like domain-containing protein [Terriglobia bacterium]